MATSTIAVDRLAEDRQTRGTATLVLDVRNPAEFATAHIEGSYNVPLDTLTEHRSQISPRLDQDVVLVCRSGARAQQAGSALEAHTATNLHVLSGGISAWRAAGHAVVEGEPRWDLERQVRLVAGSIVLSSVLASTVAPTAKWVAAAIGSGLTFAALSNSCLMATMLSKLPYNKPADPQKLIAEFVGR